MGYSTTPSEYLLIIILGVLVRGVLILGCCSWWGWYLPSPPHQNIVVVTIIVVTSISVTAITIVAVITIAIDSHPLQRSTLLILSEKRGGYVYTSSFSFQQP